MSLNVEQLIGMRVARYSVINNRDSTDTNGRGYCVLFTVDFAYHEGNTVYLCLFYNQPLPFLQSQRKRCVCQRGSWKGFGRRDVFTDRVVRLAVSSDNDYEI